MCAHPQASARTAIGRKRTRPTSLKVPGNTLHTDARKQDRANQLHLPQPPQVQRFDRHPPKRSPQWFGPPMCRMSQRPWCHSLRPLRTKPHSCATALARSRHSKIPDRRQSCCRRRAERAYLERAFHDCYFIGSYWPDRLHHGEEFQRSCRELRSTSGRRRP